jgi:Protein of unknown function (DUF1524)
LLLPPLPAVLRTAAEPRSRRVPAWGFVALVSVAWIVGIASLAPDGASVASDRTGTPADGSSDPAMAMVDRLVVAPPAGDESYDRDLFGNGWIDADHDGCDTRAEVLMAESRSTPQVDPFGCHVVAGDWLSSYDGHIVTDAAELDIDHVVALAEAWRSGASTWPPERRLAYANDLDPDTLIAVTTASNAAKSDRDPASWQPPDPADRCRFATAWTAVKVRWGLTADAAEVAALRSILGGC